VRPNGKSAPGKLAIVNLQTTPLDRHATVRAFARCDDVMRVVMAELNIAVPDAPPAHPLTPLPPREFDPAAYYRELQAKGSRKRGEKAPPRKGAKRKRNDSTSRRSRRRGEAAADAHAAEDAANENEQLVERTDVAGENGKREQQLAEAAGDAAPRARWIERNE
jgi:hypothetical protein